MSGNSQSRRAKKNLPVVRIGVPHADAGLGIGKHPFRQIEDIVKFLTWRAATLQLIKDF